MDLSRLRPFQQEHARRLARFLLTNRGALDASDTGTGKTYVAAWIAAALKTVPLVICPKSVKHDWATAMQFMGTEAEIVNYERARGHKKKGEETTASAWGSEQSCGQGSRWVWASSYELIIFDEVDRCGGMTSLNSKMLIAARRQARFVLCLSATAAEDPRQLKALGFTLRLFTLDRFKFWLLSNGCKPGIWGGFDFLGNSTNVVQRVKGRAAMLKIHADIFNGGKGARMRKDEIPGFPQTRIEVKLIDDESGQAVFAAQKLRAVYGVYGYGEGRDLELLTALRQELELLKVPYLWELAEHYAKTGRVIIFVNYRQTAEELRKLAKQTFHTGQCVIDGSNTEAERIEILRRAQANELPVVICNSQTAAGIGLHDPTGLVERTSLISPCYSARMLEQVFGRPHRVGAAFSLQLLIGFANTQEEQIANVVLNKRGNLQALNDAELNGQLT